jgi:5-methylcytosine-specific restriction endonuclease McrA
MVENGRSVERGEVAPPGRISKAFLLAAKRAGLKFCSKCHKALPLNCFGKNTAAGDGLCRYCKECKARLDKGNYRRKKKALRKDRFDRKRILVNMLGGKCVRCGYSEFLSALDFHHVNSDEKDIGISEVVSMVKPEQVQEELDKCALLCRNCHGALHGGEWFAEFIRRRDVGWHLR